MADLDLRQDGDVVWATMNRPDRLNALSRGLVTELREFFVDLYWRRDVRVVVLQGAGERLFTAPLTIEPMSTIAFSGGAVAHVFAAHPRLS
jgi:enoyl-CoA hydratase/carnithine racemase